MEEDTVVIVSTETSTNIETKVGQSADIGVHTYSADTIINATVDQLIITTTQQSGGSIFFPVGW